jgi:selT/selW/selH-like putative selenoprotein
MEKQILRIEYCAPCNYLPRTLWHVEELLNYLGGEIACVELIPATKGRYHVSIGDHVLFSKEVEGRFPEPEELMVAICAVIGHPVPKL